MFWLHFWVGEEFKGSSVGCAAGLWGLSGEPKLTRSRISALEYNYLTVSFLNTICPKNTL